MFKRSVLSLAILAAFPLAVSQAALAQATPDNPPASAGAPVEAAAAEVQSAEEIIVRGKFLATGASSAMKLDVPVRDTPFSVSAYTESFMKAIETTNVSDLFKYMTGITRAGATALEMNIRGFKTGVNDRNAMMVDGLPGLPGRFNSAPTIATDHVEVVRGPASVLYGQAQPGGFVNLITKKPSSEESLDFGVKGTAYKGDKLKLGDATGYDFELDATGPIDADKRFLYRVVAESGDRDLFRDYTYNKGSYVAPSLTWKLSPVTSATVSAEYRKTTTSYDQGLVPPNRDIRLIAPLTTVYQSPSDSQTETAKTLSLALTHEFENAMKWNFGARAVNTSDSAKGYDNVAVRANLTSLQMRARGQENERTSRFADTNLILPFKTDFVNHKMIVGANGGYDTADTNRTQFFNGLTCTAAVIAAHQCLDINLYNPVYNLPSLDSLPLVNTGSTNLTDRYTKSKAAGVYAADLMTLSEQWKVNVGVRYTYDSQFIKTLIKQSAATLPDQSKSAKKALPLAGLLYQPTKDLTFYSSYSASYVPAASNAVDVNGLNPFKPESSKQLEVGAKADMMDGKVQSTLALFNIKKKDVLTTFTCPIGTCTQQIGAERAKGIELEINARPLEGWQMAIGAAHTLANITDSSDPVQVGVRLANAAKDSAHIWSRYNFSGGALQGFGVGVGVSYTSDRAGILPTTANKAVIDLSAYTVADLAFYYIHNEYDVTLKIGNLFDKLYYESTGPTPEVQVIPGAPRNFALSFRVHF